MRKKIANINDDSPLDWGQEVRDMHTSNQLHEGHNLGSTFFNRISQKTSSIDVND